MAAWQLISTPVITCYNSFIQLVSFCILTVCFLNKNIIIVDAKEIHGSIYGLTTPHGNKWNWQKLIWIVLRLLLV